VTNFNAGYVPPGIYVTADTSAVTSAVGIGPTVICFVGPGLGYRTYTDYVNFAYPINGLITLSQESIIENSIVVTLASDSTQVWGTQTNDPGTNYTLSANAVDGNKLDVTNIGLPADEGLIFTYQYADATYYGLNQFNDFNSFQTMYGAPFDSNGNLQSPISLAAQVAFGNGANVVYGVTLTPSGSTVAPMYDIAYGQTINNFDIDLLVPVFQATTGTGTFPGPQSLSDVPDFISGLTTHLQLADTEGVPRNAIFGVPEDFDPSVTPDQIASLFAYRRVVVVWPNVLNYYNSAASGAPLIKIGGSYLAAACAGVLANNITAQGLTRRQIGVISGIDASIVSQQTTSNKNSWSSQGVSVLELNRSGQLVIRHGVSTDMSSILTQEFSIVRCQDELFKEIEQTLESSGLIGTPIDSTTLLGVKGLVAGALEAVVAAETIQAYSSLAVRQQALPDGDPTIIECTFIYQPTYPLNYITVTFAFDLTTGAVTSTDDTASSSSSS
jgi:hypothetical protein